MDPDFILPEILSVKNPDQVYLQQIKKLDREIKAKKSGDRNLYHRNGYLLLKKFSESYLMPREYWEKLIRHEYVFDPFYIKEASRYQFFHPGRDHFWPVSSKEKAEEKIISNPRRKFMQIFNEENEHIYSSEKKNLDSLVSSLQYPNCDINDAWAVYEFELCTFPSKIMVKTYQKTRNLYFKLKTIEENSVFEWFNALMEVENDEFVTQNVEYRLGKDLTNKILWKLYIKFWEKKDKKIMLHLYSKFCRIFPGIKSIKAEYEKEAKKYGTPLPVPWLNPFSFEKYEQNFDFNSLIFQNQTMPKKKQQKNIRRINQYFTSENAMPQKFPFRQSFIDYIYQTATPKMKQSLQFLCKYFFIQNPVLICYKFIAQKMVDQNKPLIKFYQNTVTIDGSNLLKANIKKICISTVFNFSVCDNQTLLSTFIPKIAKCVAKFVILRCQTLTLEELKVIIGHGNVEEILLQNVMVYNKIEGKNVSVEEILRFTPKVKKITLPTHPVTTSFFEALNEILFQTKLELLDFINVKGEDFNPSVFLQFLKEKASPRCKIKLFFKFSDIYTLDQMYQRVMTFDIKNQLESFFNGDEKPEYQCHYTIG